MNIFAKNTKAVAYYAKYRVALLGRISQWNLSFLFVTPYITILLWLISFQQQKGNALIHLVSERMM